MRRMLARILSSPDLRFALAVEVLATDPQNPVVAIWLMDSYMNAD